jgi:hypothetical protein
MTEPEHEWRVDDVHVWIDPDGGITIKAATPKGDPVEISSDQAKQLADALVEAATIDERD